MKLTNFLDNKHTKWERFQALHLLVVSAGGNSDCIYLHPDSIEALTLEMAPRKRGEVFDPPHITGAVTAAGYAKILPSDDGIVL